MKTKFPTTADELQEWKDIDKIETITEATSDDGRQERWTELGIYYQRGADRPFLAVSIGRSLVEGEADLFRIEAKGTLEGAVSCFDPSILRDDMVRAIPDDAATTYPSADEARAIRAAENRGYKGDANLADAARWLYFDFDECSTHTIALRLESDFGVPVRTATNALNGQGKPTGWLHGFLKALRFVDRKAFHRETGHG